MSYRRTLVSDKRRNKFMAPSRPTEPKGHPQSKTMAGLGGWRMKVMAQHVVGSVPTPVTAAFLNAAFDGGLPVLLLGYKDVGFGKAYARQDNPKTFVTELRLLVEAQDYNVSLSVDTALVNEYPEMLEALSVPDALVTSPEGKFSCYVDAVTGKMGPSSYVEPSTMTPLPATVDQFKEMFATY